MRIFDQKLDFPVMAALVALLALPGMGFAASVISASFSTDRSTLYAGEPFQLTLAIRISGETLDKQINIANLPAASDMQLRGFEELPTESLSRDGLVYEVRKFRTWARAGKARPFTLAPRLDGTLIRTSRSFFMMQETRHPMTIPVVPFPLTVLPLPDTGRPSDFSGLVGKFTFRVHAEPLDIAVGDLITLSYTVEGDWLPETFKRPSLESCQGLKVYELKPVAGESLPAKLVYQQTVVPETAAITSLPACVFNYFDPRTSCYRAITGGPFRISYHAERPAHQAIYAPTQSVEATDPSNLISRPSHQEPASWWQRIVRPLSQKQGIIVQENGGILVRLAPSDSAQELFTVNQGELVIPEASREGWIRISCPKGIGWIPKNSIQ